VLVEGIKDGRSGVTCLSPLTVYNKQGTYTKQFQMMYEGTDNDH
jgi:tRNA1(Val) A37 N6-methylase TrmN6